MRLLARGWTGPAFLERPPQQRRGPVGPHLGIARGHHLGLHPQHGRADQGIRLLRQSLSGIVDDLPGSRLVPAATDGEGDPHGQLGLGPMAGSHRVRHARTELPGPQQQGGLLGIGRHGERLVRREQVRLEARVCFSGTLPVAGELGGVRRTRLDEMSIEERAMATGHLVGQQGLVQGRAAAGG
ncbi:MAG TPA: hypothetical protein VFK34_08465 [Marmoricola sp.]|nr:hypothetical protein [Marmoricola sp.]